jgi:hypothetical protein
MTCEFCGGYVEWKGRLTDLTHTECDSCGAINCQEVEDDLDEEITPSIREVLPDRRKRRVFLD